MKPLFFELSLEEKINIDGGVEPTKDTSLANDVAHYIGKAAGYVVCGYNKVSAEISSWFN